MVFLKPTGNQVGYFGRIFASLLGIELTVGSCLEEMVGECAAYIYVIFQICGTKVLVALDNKKFFLNLEVL